jgi:hypothetical protein
LEAVFLGVVDFLVVVGVDFERVFGVAAFALNGARARSTARKILRM